MQYLKVAGLNIEIEGAEYEYFKNTTSKYQITKPQSIDLSVRINMTDNIEITKPCHIYEDGGRFYFCKDNKYGFYDYDRELDKVLSYMTTSICFNDVTYDVCDTEKYAEVPRGIAVKNYIGHFFNDALVQHGGIVAHASTIVYENQAITFTASSGTGKSTHTGLWKRYYPETIIINDDMPAISEMNGTYHAFGTPWSGKTAINENVSAPLKAMVFIERADVCSIEEIKPIDGLLRMLGEVRTLPYKAYSDKLIENLSNLFKSVPSYLLRCNISRDAVDIVKNKIFK